MQSLETTGLVCRFVRDRRKEEMLTEGSLCNHELVKYRSQQKSLYFGERVANKKGKGIRNKKDQRMWFLIFI